MSTPLLGKIHCARGRPSLLPLGGVGNVQERCRPLLGPLASSVVAGGGLHVGVPGQLLRRREIRSCIEQISDEGAPHVMGREARRFYLLTEPPEDVVDRLVGHPPPLDIVALVDRIQQWPGLVAADLYPRLYRVLCAPHSVGHTVLTALAAPDPHLSGLRVVVSQVERRSLAPSKSAPVQQRDHGRVSCAPVLFATFGANLEEPPKLALGERAAGGSGVALDCGEVSRPLVVLGA